ncbi:hypothetical protein [Albirhodobacter sp. R86504]|jgi:DNA-binding response OmpR family regulator|uniref:hypothetical protein n=1 Tax=Albirhodobacter sp. R86504 TaxID=3093848 RepID=UPI003672A2B3
MRIIFLEDNTVAAKNVVRSLTADHHHILHTDSTSLAQSYARLDPPDLLIASLFPKGTGCVSENGLSVAMAAQFHNPDVVTIFLSDSPVFSQGELFAMISSLRCVLPRPIQVHDLVEIARYFLRVGPVDCALAEGAPDLCGRCVLSDSCERQARLALPYEYSAERRDDAPRRRACG